jgi:hypothetical protein
MNQQGYEKMMRALARRVSLDQRELVVAKAAGITARPVTWTPGQKTYTHQTVTPAEYQKLLVFRTSSSRG